MSKLTGMMLLLVGMATLAFANPGPPVPEIDPGSCMTTLALVGGAWLVVRGRRKA